MILYGINYRIEPSNKINPYSVYVHYININFTAGKKKNINFTDWDIVVTLLCHSNFDKLKLFLVLYVSPMEGMKQSEP